MTKIVESEWDTPLGHHWEARMVAPSGRIYNIVKVRTAKIWPDLEMAVGQDHWNRLEAAIRQMAALTDGGGE